MKSMKPRGTIMGVVIGVLVALAIMLIITLIFTTLLLEGKMAESTLNHLGMATNIISSLIGCVITGKLVKEKLAIRIGIGAAIYFVSLLAVNLLLLEGGLQNCWKGLLSVVIGYISACAICIRKGKPRGFKKFAYR